MFRRVLSVGALCALLVMSTAPAAIARGPSLPAELKERFERLDVDGARALRQRIGAKGANEFGAADTKVDVIVQLDGPTLADRVAAANARGQSLGKSERNRIVNNIRSAQAASLNRARNAGAKIGHTYQAAFNGFSARVSWSDLAQLSAQPGVVAIHPVRKVERNNQPTNERGVPYIGTPAAWEDLGLTGSGIKIGIIDTGLDYQHANFGGDGTDTFPTAKVAGGYDFVGDDYDGDNSPVPDPDPMDCDGHGSHVGGTAAGMGVLEDGSTYTGPYDGSTISGNTWKIGPGVAPEATLYGYRVFGCEGFTTSEIIVAAIDMALADGVHVINMSLGSAFGLPDEPDSIASNAASVAGMMVVASAGNNGPGAYITGSPGAATRVLSVAAMDGGFATLPTALIDIDGVGTMANNNSGGPLPVTADIMVLPDQGLEGPGAGGISLGCDESEYAGVAGKIVVTVRGVCARVDRAIFGQANGAVAVIMINNAASLPPYEGSIPGVTIPFLGAFGSAAVRAAFVAADGTERTITPGADIPSPSYKGLASFTSGGPRNTDSAAKPDITAPGVSVVSTAAGTGNEGTTLSGTSMAAPHAAGVAALVVQNNPGWSPQAIKAAMMNTATTSTDFLTNSNVRLAGAGLVDPRKAVDTRLYATTGPGQASLSFGAPAASGPYSDQQTITFHNTGSSAVTLNLSNSFQSTAGVSASLTFNRSSVSVAAGGTATVNVRLRLSASAVRNLPDALVSNFGDLVTIRGAVTATPTAGGDGLYPLRIPYLMAPRGTSNVKAANTINFANSSTAILNLNNAGVHWGDADFYAWGVTSPNSGLGHADIRAAGVQSFALGGGETFNVFAANMHGMWSNPSHMFISFYVDVDGDFFPDYLVEGFDLFFLVGSLTGQYVSYTWTYPAFNLVDAWVASAPMNSSTAILPQGFGTDIGLGAGNSQVNYIVNTFDIITGASDWSDWASFDVLDQPVSTGHYVELNPRQSATVGLSIDRDSLAAHPQLGWMVVSLDDPAGAPQADLVGLRYRP